MPDVKTRESSYLPHKRSRTVVVADTKFPSADVLSQVPSHVLTRKISAEIWKIL